MGKAIYSNIYTIGEFSIAMSQQTGGQYHSILVRFRLSIFQNECSTWLALTCISSLSIWLYVSVHVISYSSFNIGFLWFMNAHIDNIYTYVRTCAHICGLFVVLHRWEQPSKAQKLQGWGRTGKGLYFAGKSPFFNRSFHYKRLFQIAILNCQKVDLRDFHPDSCSSFWVVPAKASHSDQRSHCSWINQSRFHPFFAWHVSEFKTWRPRMPQLPQLK